MVCSLCYIGLPTIWRAPPPSLSETGTYILYGTTPLDPHFNKNTVFNRVGLGGSCSFIFFFGMDKYKACISIFAVVINERLRNAGETASGQVAGMPLRDLVKSFHLPCTRPVKVLRGERKKCRWNPEVLLGSPSP